MTLDQMTRMEVVKALRQTKWNMSEACKFLGISRATLYRYVKKYQIREELNGK